MKNLWEKHGNYILNILLALLVGALAGLISRPGMERYVQLIKPPQAPPGWVFPVVWTVLYILMGLAAGIVQQSDVPGTNHALGVYYAQLAANFLWPIIFFGLEARLAAFVWLIILLALVIYTAKLFYHISSAAGKLLIPYILWLLFAAYLNLGAYLMNR